MESHLPLFVPAYGAPSQSGEALQFLFIGQDLVLAEHATFPAHGDRDVAGFGPASEAISFGKLGNLPCEMLVWPASQALPDGLVRADFRHLSAQWAQGQFDAMSRARQLAVWLHQNKYCGACGQALHTRADEPARECGACKARVYPRISPVCIGLVVKGDELLLARSPHFPPGIYSALAGFVEAGESAEQCLRREILEEAGVEVRNIRWFGSQSWPYPHSLMMGFIADYAGGELCPQADEIEDLQWFKKDRLPSLPHPSTIAFQMIQEVLRTS